MNLLAATCATGYAIVFTIGDLHVACVARCLGKVVSLESKISRRALDQPTCVSTRFLNQWAATCATGYASVFTIGGLYVACVVRCLGQVVSRESYLQAFGKKSTGKASGTQDLLASRVREHAGSWRSTLVSDNRGLKLLSLLGLFFFVGLVALVRATRAPVLILDT